MIIANKDNEILICKKKGGNGWGLPIGKMLQNEGTVLTAIRVLKTDFNLDASSENLYNTGIKYKLTQGSEIDLAQEVFIVKLEKKKFNIDIIKSLDYYWTSIDNLINFVENEKLKILVKDIYPLVSGYLSKKSI